MTGNGYALRIDNLTYAYPDNTPALRGLSLDVAEGEKVALVGANGAGKSTLLLHLNGTLQGVGTIEVLGVPVTRKSLKTVRRHVGLIFQNPDDQLFCPTLFDDVSFGPRNMGLPEEDVKRRVDQALDSVGLAGFQERNAYHLSLGQKRRAALATVLSMDVTLLAFDEPTGGLDPRGRREMIDLLGSLERTLILATHDLALVRSLCTRTIVLNEGKVATEGETGAILDDEELLRAHGLA